MGQKNVSAAVKLFLHCTGHSGILDRLAGPNRAAARADILSALTGWEKVPKNMAGINALRKALAEEASATGCIAEVETRIQDWALGYFAKEQKIQEVEPKAEAPLSTEDEFYKRMAKILGFPPEAANYNDKGEPEMPFKFAVLQAVAHFAGTEGYVEAEPIVDHPELKPLFCTWCGRLHNVANCPRKK